MDYGFNGTINKFSYINKKSINILLYSTIIANIVFNIQNIENTIQDKSNPLNNLGILFSCKSNDISFNSNVGLSYIAR